MQAYGNGIITQTSYKFEWFSHKLILVVRHDGLGECLSFDLTEEIRRGNCGGT